MKEKRATFPKTPQTNSKPCLSEEDLENEDLQQKSLFFVLSFFCCCHDARGLRNGSRPHGARTQDYRRCARRDGAP